MEIQCFIHSCKMYWKEGFSVFTEFGDLSRIDVIAEKK
jgi:hypothetical protein